MENQKVTWLIHTPAPDLEASAAFYADLGFSLLTNTPYPIWQSDACLVVLKEDPYARAGVQLFAKDWSKEVQALTDICSVYSVPDGHLFFAPSGTAVYLMNQENTFTLGAQKSLLGNFAGLSLETADLKASLSFWSALGFEHQSGSPEQGWISLQHSSRLGVSLMQPLSCPHLFFNPSLTYFNGKNNLAIIEQIREAGVSIAQEITFFNPENVVDNIILRDPGGYGFFVFSD